MFFFHIYFRTIWFERRMGRLLVCVSVRCVISHVCSRTHFMELLFHGITARVSVLLLKYLLEIAVTKPCVNGLINFEIPVPV